MCRDTPHEAWAILWKTEPRNIMSRIANRRYLRVIKIFAFDKCDETGVPRTKRRSGHARTRRELGVHDFYADAVCRKSRIASRSGMVNPATSAILKRAILRPVPEQPTSAPSDAILLR